MNNIMRYLFPLGEALLGWSVLEKLALLEEIAQWDEGRLQEFQAEHLRHLVSHAYRHVPFYRDLYDKWGVRPEHVKDSRDLSSLPIVSKTDLVEAGARALSQNMPKKQLVFGRSSGSTGEPFVYYKTKEHHSWFIAGNFLGWKWAGWKPGDRWIRLQYRPSMGLLSKLEDWAFNCLNMPISQLDARFLKNFLPKARRFNPKMIRGYAGGTYVFSRFILENSIDGLSPDFIASTGDTLYPHYRETIEKAFQCPVYDSYGGEGMVVANQCQHRNYHILPNVLAEALVSIKKKSEIDTEQPQKLILTSLTNLGMPFIRYDIGDMTILGKGGCSCGMKWPYLKKILGRDTDICVTPEGRYLVCHHFNNIIRKFTGVKQFQILQPEINRIEIKVVASEFFSCEESQKMLLLLEELCGSSVHLVLQKLDSIPSPASGKRRYIISSVDKTSLCSEAFS
jgi:phenylacetate-CoA ligase